MHDNPYQSPQADLDSPRTGDDRVRSSIAARRILGIARTFGVLGAGYFCTVALGSTVFLIACWWDKGHFTDPDLPSALLAMVIGVVLTGVFVVFIRVARRLRRGDPTVKPAARLLCCLFILAFPLLTLPGLLALVQLNRHYDAFCRENERAVDR